jgi:hypothetical protein
MRALHSEHPTQPFPYSKSSIAHRANGERQLVRITHPFHPLFGEEFEFVYTRLNWGEERVNYFDRNGSIASIPARWTSVIEPDPFVVASGGRSYFCLNDLLELSRLVRKLEGEGDE